MSHRNARLTPHGRLLLCERVEDGRLEAAARRPRPPASAARRRASGSPAGAPRVLPASLDRSSRPLRIALRVVGASAAPRRAAAPQEAPRPGLDRLAHAARPGDRLPRPAAPPPAPPARARAARAGGALLLAARRRPRAPRHQEAGAHRRRRRQALRRPALKHRHRGIGWDYAHVAVDDATRLAYAEELADERGRDGGRLPRARAGLLRGPRHLRAAPAHRQRQLLPLARLRAPPPSSTASGIWRTRPYRPQTNGKAEAFVKIVQNGWAYKRPYDSTAERIAALPALPALLQWLPTAWRPGRRHTAGQTQVNNLVMQNS